MQIVLPSKLLFPFDFPSTHPPLLSSLYPHFLPPTMSVVGIDLGAQSTKIGVARNKGIDIVRIMPRDSNLSLSIWNDAHVFAAGP